MSGQLAPHEALDLHEVMRTETLALTKMTAMMPLVSDPELKAYMQDASQKKQVALQQMRGFAMQANQASQTTMQTQTTTQAQADTQGGMMQ